MFIDYWPTRTGRAVASGKENGCPICVSRLSGLPENGESIRLLSIVSGLNRMHGNGEVGIVISTANFQLTDDSETHVIEVKFATNPERNVKIYRKHHLYQRFPLPEVPNWAPPLKKLDDWLWLDELVVFFGFLLSYDQPQWWLGPNFGHFIRLLSQERLPVSEREVWQLVAAHGAPASAREAFEDRVQFGIELLGNRKYRSHRGDPKLAYNRY